MRNHIITPCNSISSDSCAVPCRRESRIMRGGLYMYAKTHRLNACSTARDTYTRKKKNGRSEKTGVCMRPKKNRLWHVFKYASPEASSPARDTFSRQINKDWSEKEAVCMRQNKNGSCAADHTCIQIGITWTAPQVLLTHTHTQEQKWSVTKGRSLYATKKNLIVRGRLYIDWNRIRLNAYSTAPDTYTRDLINGLSEKARVCMRPKKKDCARRIIHVFK